MAKLPKPKPRPVQLITLKDIDLGTLLREISDRGWKITLESRSTTKTP